MVQYLLWRMMSVQHTEITLSFMIPGHTKFSPDWCFGLLKKRYWRTKVGGLTDLITVVISVNIAQPTGQEDGSPIVITYNSQDYFSTFCTKVKVIKKLHYLRFSSSSPVLIFVKEKAGSPEVQRNLLKVKDWSPKADKLPPNPTSIWSLTPAAWYLYKIREFCPDHLKDATCPLPSKPADNLLSHPPPISSFFPLTYSSSHQSSH